MCWPLPQVHTSPGAGDPPHSSVRQWPQWSHPQASRAGGKQRKTLKSSQQLFFFPSHTSRQHHTASMRSCAQPLRHSEEGPGDASGDLGRRPGPCQRGERGGRIHHRSHLALHRSPYHVLHRRRRAGQALGREQKHTAPLVWHSDLRFRDKQGVSQPCPRPPRWWPWRQETDPALPR